MRILLITDEYPWPPRSGYRQRIAGVLTGLAQIGDVDVFAVVPGGRQLPLPPADAPHDRLTVVPTRPRQDGRATRLRRWLSANKPRSLLWRDWTAPRAELSQLPSEGYDVIWFSHAASYLAMQDLVPGPPHIVDLDNLESFVLRHRRAAVFDDPLSELRPTALARAAGDFVDARRWRRIERDIPARVGAVVVCSELDRERLGHPDARIVPNGYEPHHPASTGGPSRADGRPVGDSSVNHPTFLMVGLLTYAPNRDAAGFFARRVLPIVRAEIPEAEFRVIGRYDGPSDIGGYGKAPGVVVTGEVPDLRDELMTATVAVVPIRFGGGTRIKILEAFAWRIPVVSTSVGAEGLAVAHGKHLLIADTPGAFAQACLRLVIDEELRSRMTSAAWELWSRRYRWPTINAALRATVAHAVGERHGD